jgi:hypothetical protein
MTNKAGRALAEGCYVILSPSSDATPESSEIRALRKAVAIGGNVVFVKWGQSVDEAVAASKDAPEVEAKPRATRKKAEPKAEAVADAEAKAEAIQENEPMVSPVDGNDPSDF